MVAGEPVLDLTRMFSSLMRAQLTRLKIFCPQSIIHTRTFGALRSHRSRSPPSKQKEISEKDDSNVKILETRKRSAIIQTSSVIKSLAHAYAIIRAVEEKYGPVMEYRFLRDYEIPSSYQFKAHIVFKHTESYERVPKTSHTFQVPAPTIIQDRPGGIGLDELKDLMTPRRRSEELTSFVGKVVEEEHNTIECLIKRAHKEFYSESHALAPSLSQSTRENISRDMLSWGGAYDLKPIDSSIPITNEELFGESKLDHVRMRRVLRMHAQNIGIGNPHEYRSQPVSRESNAVEGAKGNPTELQNRSEWEPLPGAKEIPGETTLPPLVKKRSRMPRVWAKLHSADE